MSGQMENDEWILATLEKAMEKGRDVLCEGAVANYIPELAKANPSNLGVCIRTEDGRIYETGDFDIPFTMQSISKTFSLILALQTAGYEYLFSKVGMEPTGDRFDSILFTAPFVYYYIAIVLMHFQLGLG